MRRSKLEMYVDILRVLTHNGPLKLTHIMYKANVNCSILDECLSFLINQALVEKRTISRNRVVFVVTQKGISVVKYFRELKQVLPIVDENQKPNRHTNLTAQHLVSQFYREIFEDMNLTYLNFLILIIIKRQQLSA